MAVGVYKLDMRFPQDLPRFLYLIYFKPYSFHIWINELDPAIGNVTHLLIQPSDRSVRAFRNLTFFYVLVMPWLVAAGTALVLTGLGLEVNWLRLALALLVAIPLSLSFSIQFCIAFLLAFSVTAVFWNSQLFSPAVGVFFSLMLGLAYGLGANSARWGLTAGLVYAVFLTLLLGPWVGLSIGAAFLVGYFRILFYIVEAPLSWILGRLAAKGDAVRLWRFHPVTWDELIWFPLPGLDQHLLALKRQDEGAAQAAIFQVQESFRQGWAAEKVLGKEARSV
jgi:hypothetical protein